MTEEQPWRQQLKGVRAFVETLKELERDTTTIAGMFAEALGHIEDALWYLGQVNEQYDPEEHRHKIRLIAPYRPRPYNPALDFWLQTEQAEEQIKKILSKLQRVALLAPKDLKEKNQ